MARRKLWGWGNEGEGIDEGERRRLDAALLARFPNHRLRDERPPRPDDLELRPPRTSLPPALAQVGSTDPFERATHTYGKSYRDLIRSLRGRYPNPPDVVATPPDEAGVTALLEWCADAGVAAIPYGGGTSVVGGVEPEVGDAYRGVVSIDLRALGRVLEVDERSGLARVQAGILGPALEAALEPHGLTLRHYPQSFEHSTLGGWIATRSAGHHATVRTHIEDHVAGLRVVTPSGVVETRRLPASGAGPAPERLFAGSEGALGIITEAWIRVRERPSHRASAAVTFPSFAAGLEAVRALARSDLHPSACRLLDPLEALIGGAGDGSAAVLLVGFESHDHPVEAPLELALACCRDHGGESSVQEAASSWRRSFLRGPHLRDEIIRRGFVLETFETAAPWRDLEGLVAAVRETVEGSIDDPLVTVRVTHAYPDGAAPYFTVVAPARRGGEVEQWDAAKAAASDAILEAGGTITHHHAVGRDHRPWYEREVPGALRTALRAAKAALDPAWILNPGVLVDRDDESRRWDLSP